MMCSMYTSNQKSCFRNIFLQIQFAEYHIKFVPTLNYAVFNTYIQQEWFLKISKTTNNPFLGGSGNPGPDLATLVLDPDPWQHWF